MEDEQLDAIDTVAAEAPTTIAVHVSTRGKLRRSHPRRSIRREVRRWLDGIDPHTDLHPSIDVLAARPENVSHTLARDVVC